MRKIFISTSTFAEFDTAPVDLLKKAGFEVALNPLGRTLAKDEISQLASDASGLVAGTELIDGEVLRKLKNLKVVSRCGAGMDNVDLKTAGKLNIKVFNTPDGPTLAVAELTIGLILTLIRKISYADRQIRSGKWQKNMGNLLSGKRVGIIGFGRVGRKAAQLLSAFETKIVYYDPFISENAIGGAIKVNLSELLAGSDIVSLHLSYSDKSKNLIGEKELKLMKKDAVLINCSRGGIVDEGALYTAIKEGEIAGAAIDVFEQEPYGGPLKELDNVVLTSHIGSYAKEARIKMEMDSAKNLLEGLK